MPYALGIDLGSGATTAAISRNDRERWSEPEIVPLDGEPAAASVLHLTDEGTIEVGARVLRHVPTRSDRITRGLVDRIGDEIPVTLGGQPYSAEVLAAALVGWVVDHAEAAEGIPASQVVVTHPAGWGVHRRAALLGALREVDMPELTLLPRPVAAAESYGAGERIEVGEEVAVYSLGAGRFESAVLRRGSFGFELRAHADSAATLGGDLFDDLLAEHVVAELGGEVDAVALAQLRAACVTAKERLSTELAVTVPAPRGSARGTVMVNRTELERLVRPAVEATVRSLQRTIGASAGSLRAVVLVGGCGRIPLVTELVSAGVRVRVAAAADPETAVARGAALAAARVAKPTVKATGLTVRPEPMPRSAVTHTDLMRFDDEADIADVGPPPPRPPVEITPLEPPKRRLLRLGSRTTRANDELDVDLEPVHAPGTRSRQPRDNALDDHLARRRDDDSGFHESPPRRPPEDGDYNAAANPGLTGPSHRRSEDSGHHAAAGPGPTGTAHRRSEDSDFHQGLARRPPDSPRHRPSDSGSPQGLAGRAEDGEFTESLARRRTDDSAANQSLSRHRAGTREGTGMGNGATEGAVEPRRGRDTG